MKICFVLPKFTRQSIGGYKMVFEYANRFQDAGNQVVILFLNEDALKKFRLPVALKKVLANMITQIEPKWFALNKKIKKYSSLQKNCIRKIGDCDIVFATGVTTSEIVKKEFENAKKFYFIQGYENWTKSDEYVVSTYNYGFKNIVISDWLKKIVDGSCSEKSILIKNPVDTSIYVRERLQTERKEHTIGLLYHTMERKGVQYALKAIYLLKERYKDLTVEMFGMFPKPDNLPDWIHYQRGASQTDTVKVYNTVQVFLCASVEEGYGLTGIEAMACGACLVSTAYQGVLEYAENNYNSLLSDVKDVDALVNNVSKLFEDEKERCRISDNGVRTAKEFSWDEAMYKMYELFNA